MLKTMRESFHQLKWTLFAVIAVFILGFVFYSGGSNGDPSSRVVASVGSEQITAQEFDRVYRAQVDRYRQMYQGNFSPELEKALDLPRNVLDGMIEKILRLEAARRLDLRVSDDEVARKIVTLPYFVENGQFIGRDQYEKRLRASGLSPERFEEELREDMLLQKYSDLVKASVIVPDADLLREYAARNDKATIEYILVPASRLESTAQPTDADLQQYLDKHKDRYRTPVQRRIKYLLVDRAKVRAKVKVSDAEVAAEYEKNKDQLTVPEQVTAAHILVSVKPDSGPAGDAAAKAKADMIAAKAQQPNADFAKLANENTDDPSGKGSGGQLPPFARGQMAPEFEQAAFSMAPGEIRGPVKTQFGYHVIKLISKSPARTRTLDEVKPQLSAQIAERQASADAERIGKELSAKLKDMKSASDEDLRKLQTPDNTITFNTTEWVAKTDAIPGIGANQAFTDEAWTLGVGKVSAKEITVPRGIAFVKASEERAAGMAPFAELKPRLEADWKAERRQKDALAQLEPASKELSSGATLASLASRYQTEVKTTTEFGPSGPVPEIGAAPELAAAVFKTPQGQAGPPVSVPNGFVLFRVLTRKEASRDTFQAQRDELRESLRTKEAERLTRSYLSQLRAERKVEVNEPLLASFMREGSSSSRGGRRS
ncbi:MAG TPA: SurA N-terminal domain-containing protein [Thermoanaerobaculia bacterium]|jgi:peptidyl-prolyl cis-trans isomerase D|nr:SurA N-terminal domain-containing protein [Thermoanaerobaculia bacterium]